MKLLQNKRAWKKWVKGQRFGSTIDPTLYPEPTKFPCYVYLTVASFNYQEEQANYLNADDIERMRKELWNFDPTYPKDSAATVRDGKEKFKGDALEGDIYPKKKRRRQPKQFSYPDETRPPDYVPKMLRPAKKKPNAKRRLASDTPEELRNRASMFPPPHAT